MIFEEPTVYKIIYSPFFQVVFEVAAALGLTRVVVETLGNTAVACEAWIGA